MRVVLMCDTSQIFEWRHTILRFNCRIKDFGQEIPLAKAISVSTIRSDRWLQLKA
jgi:hypothetical protein